MAINAAFVTTTVWQLILQIPMQLMCISEKVVGLIPTQYNFMKKSKMKFNKGWWDGAYYLIIVNVDEIETASVV